MRNRIPKQELDMLGEVALFRACSQGELRQIAQLGTPVPIAAGKVVMKRGEPGSEFYLVIAGTAECVVGKRTVATFGPGDYFGELAILESGFRTATVTALTPMEVLVLHRGEFTDLLRASPSISLKLLAHLAGRLRDADDALSV